MLLEPEFILFFLFLGTIVGFLAGLLGIGGGGVMVPILVSIFLSMEMSVDDVIHVSLGTSMAAIVVTSISSLRAHHLRKTVLWNYVKPLVPGVAVGTFVATYFVALMNSMALAIFFSLFMGLIAGKLFFYEKPNKPIKPSGNKHLIIVGGGIGAISALVSIGGGSLTVPYLIWRNIDMKKAIGTAAALGLPISIFGTLGYIFNGWHHTSFEGYMLGFVYLPAVLLISITSFITAPLGVKAAHYLPVTVLKKIFAGLLILLSLKMVSSII